MASCLLPGSEEDEAEGWDSDWEKLSVRTGRELGVGPGEAGRRADDRRTVDRRPLQFALTTIGVLLAVAAAVVVVVVVWHGNQNSPEAPGSSSAHPLSNPSAPTAVVPAEADVTPQRRLCESVSSCGNETCDSSRSLCWKTVSNLMADPSALAEFNTYAVSTWYPIQGLQWRGDITFEGFQMLVHLHEGAVCPMPCFPSSTSQPTQSRCPPPPSKLPAPQNVLDYNGVTLPEMCIDDDREEDHVLIIGDWGGTVPGKPADNTQNKRPKRPYVDGIDNQAQLLVAEQFNKRAALVDPGYILNVGDNFYWGGCFETCGSRTVKEAIEAFNNPFRPDEQDDPICAKQFYSVFETMYMGPGLDGKPWFSCLGNHDYGGYYFNAAWDQQIAYTWGPSGRWVMPALYYHQHVVYAAKGFTVDYYVVDDNVADVQDESQDIHHNPCNLWRNPHSDCRPFGPGNASDCVHWFRNLWSEEVKWLDASLAKSTADWQIIMTHVPVESCVPYPQVVDDFKRISDLHGVDLFVTGHRHVQEIYESGHADFNCPDGAPCLTPGVPYVVSGGGGGITSDFPPGPEGSGEDMYGYMDMKISKTEIIIEAFNQAGVPRGVLRTHPRSAQR